MGAGTLWLILAVVLMGSKALPSSTWSYQVALGRPRWHGSVLARTPADLRWPFADLSGPGGALQPQPSASIAFSQEPGRSPERRSSCGNCHS